MLHCDLRVRWKVASDLRFRAAISEPKTPSFCGISGDLAPSSRKSLAIAIVRFWCAKEICDIPLASKECNKLHEMMTGTLQAPEHNPQLVEDACLNTFNFWDLPERRDWSCDDGRRRGVPPQPSSSKLLLWKRCVFWIPAGRRDVKITWQEVFWIA